MTMRFYAACLASYNNGVLHGAWIDAESDVDSMQERINKMLRDSRFPNVRVECPECEGTTANDETIHCHACHGAGTAHSAEEWAMHDSEGLPSTLGEYCGLQAIADYVEFVETVESETGLDFDESQELANAMLENWQDVASAQSELENYAGRYESFRDYADEAADEMIACYSADGKVPQALINYFDYEAWARDLRHETTALDLPNGVAVFHS